MYRTYMPHSLVVSVFRHKKTCLVRMAKVPSLRAFKEAYARWYPDRPWVPEEHRCWFNIDNVYTEIHAELRSLIASADSKVIRDGTMFGVFKNVADVTDVFVRKTLFARVDELVQTALDNEEMPEDYMATILDRPCTYKCVVDIGKEPLEYTTEDILERVEAFKQQEYGMSFENIEHRITCLEYEEDEHNAEFPIVWSTDAMKDLLYQTASICPRTKHEVAADKRIVCIHTDLNLRSRTPELILTPQDIGDLFAQVGSDECHTTVDNVTMSMSIRRHHNDLRPLDAYYWLLSDTLKDETEDVVGWIQPTGHASVNETYMLGAPFKPSAAIDNRNAMEWSSEPNGALPKELSALNVCVLEWTKNKPQEALPGRRMGCILNYVDNVLHMIDDDVHDSVRFADMDLLPELQKIADTVLQDPEAIHSYFLRMTPIISAFQTVLGSGDIEMMGIVANITNCTMKMLANEDDDDDDDQALKANTTLLKSIKRLDLNDAHDVIEYFMTQNKLIPSTKWEPSNIVLQKLCNFITELVAVAKTHDEPLKLTTQKNQISVILATLVPKKRFFTGQMFLMKLPTPQQITVTVAEMMKNHAAQTTKWPA